MTIDLPPLIGAGMSPREMTKRDGITRLSNSEIQTFKRCRRKWYLTYYRNLQPRAKLYVGPMAIGSRFHTALQYHYESRVPGMPNVIDARDALETLIERERIIAFDDPDFNDDIETQFNAEADLERIMLDGYLEWLDETGDDANYEIIGAEVYREAVIDTSHLEIDKPVLIIARLDLRVKRLSDSTELFLDHKALRNSTPVLTPTGWTPIDQLKVNDYVIAGDGSSTVVTGVYPQGSVDIYRVKFSDNTEIDCSADHLWFAQRRTRKHPEIVTTQQLIDDVNDHYTDSSGSHHKSNNWHIPITSVNFNEDQSHIIHPYLLGVWLGDGGRNTTSFASADTEIADNISQVLNDTGLSITCTKVNDVHNNYNVTSNGKPNILARELRRLGIFSCKSDEKFIPNEYLRSSKENRLALLRGLMDTDGCIRTKTKQVLYITTSPRLRDDVAFLVRSLGGIARTTNNGPGKYVHKGITHICKTVYTVNMQLHETLNPFGIARKANIFKSKKLRHLKRWITDIQYIGQDYATCISVASSSALYIAKDMIITHNTTASFSALTKQLPTNEQMLFYLLIEFLQENPQHTSGALYNMIRRVKRSARAKPPFYERVTVYHNHLELNAFLRRTQGVIENILIATDRLNRNMDHRRVAYPTPTRDCAWDCPFAVPCKMMDDGSYAEEMLTNIFDVGDPYKYYTNGSDEHGNE